MSEEKKKPKVFIKKKSEKIVDESSDFYEYDKLNEKSEMLVDEDCFADFESIDYDALKKEKQKEEAGVVSEEAESLEEIENNNIEEKEEINIILEDYDIVEISEEESATKEKEITVEDDLKNAEEVDTLETVEKEIHPIFDDEDFGDIEEDSNPSIDKEFEAPIVEEKEIEIPVIEDKPNIEEKEIEVTFEDDDFGEIEEELIETKEAENKEMFKNQEIDDLFLNDDFGDINFVKPKDEESSDYYQTLFSKEKDTKDDLSSDEVIRAVSKPKEDLEYDDFGSIEETSVIYDVQDIQNEEKQEKAATVKKKTKKVAKKEKKKRGFFATLFKWLIIILLCTGIIGTYFALTHPVFKVDYVQIDGNIANSEELLREKCGVSKGDNIFFVSTKSIENILKTIPTIEKVEVEKNYPNIVKIKVVEKYTSAYINNSNGIVTIDNYAKISKIGNSVPITTGIQLKGLSINGLVVGEYFSNDVEMRTLLLDLLKTEYYLDIMYIDFTDKQDAVIALRDGIKIHYGKVEKSSEKLNIIRMLLEKVRKDGINCTEIILNVGKNPIIVKK